MSALRISRPGYETTFIQLGPATPIGLGGVPGFTLLVDAVPAQHLRTAYRNQQQPERPARLSPSYKRCGRIMAGRAVPGSVCGRRAGHKPGACKSAHLVERGNARRRTHGR